MRDWEKAVTELRSRLTKDEADIAAIQYKLSVVKFPDAALNAAVRGAVGVPTGDIHQSDLLKVTTFIAHGLGIVDLTGMEYWTSLTGLDLSDNSIVDLTPLAGLVNLTVLFLLINSIVDVSPLAGLVNLTTLALIANSIVDVSSLVGTMASGGKIYFDNNPLDVAAYHTDIPAIQATGVIVSFDAEPTPAAIAISPTGGTTAGGDAVDITGTGFLSGCTATIGGNPCTSVVFVSSTHLTAVTPAGLAGARDVVVTNDVNLGTLAGGFTYS